MEKTVSKKQRQINEVLFYILIGFLLLFFAVGTALLPPEREDFADDFEELDVQWYWEKSNGERIPIKTAEIYDVKSGEVFTISAQLPNDISGGECLFFRASKQDVYVYVDGMLKGKYDTKQSRLLGENSQSGYAVIELDKEDSGKNIKMTLTTQSNYSGRIDTIYIGDKHELWMNVLYKNIFSVGLSVAVIIIGIVCVIIGLLMKRKFKSPQPMEKLGWLMLCIGIFIIFDSKMRQILVMNTSLMTDFSYYFAALALVALAMFIDEVSKRNYHKMFLYYEGAVTILEVICTILYISGIVDIEFSLIAILPCAAALFVIYVITIVSDIRKKRIASYINSVIVCMVFLVLTLLGYILTNVTFTISGMGIMVGSGLLLIFFEEIIRTTREVGGMSQKLNETEYEKKAQEEFFTRISHEIRTPINSVLGMNEMIRRESEEPKIREYAYNAESSGKILLSLINDLLDFSKAENNQLKINEANYRLDSLIVETVEVIKESFENKKLSFNVVCNPQLPSVLVGDMMRIKQILINLLSNACKYTETGSVTLSFDFSGKPKEENIFLEMTVKDTGRGMKPEYLETLFDSFTRYEENKNHTIQGSGLGLAITKQLTGLMHGHISVESVYGKGSTFTVKIPQLVKNGSPIGEFQEFYNKHDETVVKEKVLYAPDSKILVVDDNKVNLTVAKALLKRSEAKVKTVESGLEALDICHSEKFDIILMDHLMPEMDGEEALKKIREDEGGVNTTTKVVVLTANAYTGIREKYLEMGFDDYVAKPIQSKALEEILLKHMRGASQKEIEVRK